MQQSLVAHSVELKPSTVKTYKDKIRLYLVPAIGHERLQSLAPSRLSVVFRDMHDHGGKDGKPVSPRTVEFARAVLRRAMNDAVVDRLIEVNPVAGSKIPKRDGKPQHTTWTGCPGPDVPQSHDRHSVGATVATGGRDRHGSR